ncbi:MAG: hypothetical protein J6U10_04970 [Lachnospiraceae bacterium]|nr:hypothetical protein [Lachnospiraceae bacterium]
MKKSLLGIIVACLFLLSACTADDVIDIINEALTEFPGPTSGVTEAAQITDPPVTEGVPAQNTPSAAPVLTEPVSMPVTNAPTPALTAEFKALAQKCSQDYDEKRVIKLIIDTLIKDDMNVVEKIKVVHDYLIMTTTYDHVNLKAGTESKSVYKTYGCIIGHRCVCQGYAYAFMDIMTAMGIECVELSGGNHAWNAVKVGDSWYYIDLTWDDPYDGSRSKPEKNVYYEFDYPHYDYFLVTEEFLTKNHTLNKAYNSDYKLIELPSCHDDRFMDVKWGTDGWSGKVEELLKTQKTVE